ncbi:MAG: 3-dehydroquinate synthase II, partial [Thermosulfidibacteraceae bacterium]
IEAQVISIEPGGMGYRTCIDTTDIMGIGEGMLVGDRSDLFLLVHSESIENPYVAPRPFRVNAGGVHAYVMMADGKTKYLYEISTGDKVLVVNHRGEGREALVGRAKIELRPLLIVKVKIGDEEGSLVLQNAETIRLTRPDGNPVSVVKLKRDDKILAYKTEGGRHFGIKVKESIKEK